MKEIIELCVQLVYQHIHLSRHNDIFIDFTAEQGLFVYDLEYLVNRAYFFTDVVKPGAHPNITPYDFLDPAFNFAKFDKTYLAGLWYDDVHVIGCPPVDKIERSIAVASTFAQSISFLLPKKSCYPIPPGYQQLYTRDFPEKKLVFHIWLKSDC
jgi:hypothetical protein